MRKEALLGWILLGAFLFPALSQAQGQSGDWLVRGREQAQSGHLEEALESYSQFKKSHPEDIRPYVLSSELLLQEGRRNDAGIELSQALSLGPQNRNQAIDLARALNHIGNPVLGTEVLRPFEQDPDLTGETLRLISDLYLQQAKYSEALNALDRSSRASDSVDAETLLLRGKILLEKGDLEGSLEAFEALARLKPDSAAAFHGLSKVSLMGNNPEAAKRMALRAVELEPGSPLYVFQLGVVLKELGETQPAIEALERARELGADPFGTSFELGDLYRKAGNMEEARKALAEYQELLGQKRRNQELVQFINQGDEQLAAGRVLEAEKTFLKVVELDPKDWTGHNRLAKIYLSVGRSRSALRSLETLLRLDPKSSETHFLLAVYWFGRQDLEKALQFGEESRRLRPGNAELRNLLGNIYLALDRPRDAALEYQSALKLDPDNAAFRANYEAVVKRTAAGKP